MTQERFHSIYAVTAAVIVLTAASLARAQAVAAQRIRFTRGSGSKTMTATLSRHRSRARYLIRVRRGQQMHIIVSSPSSSHGIVPVLDVVSPSGQSSAAQRPKDRRFDTPCTEAGDYRITVGINLMATLGTAGPFRLRVQVQP